MRAYGEQNLSWQGLRDVARGQARYWPDGRTNAVYPNGDGARSYATFSARYPEWLWRYYASTGDRTTAIGLYPSAAKAAAWLWSARQASTGLLYGLGDTSNGDPVYGYDLSVAADTASNVLAVNAFNRSPSWRTWPATPPGPHSGRPGPPNWPRPSTPRCAGPTAIYVDGVDARRRPEQLCLAGGQRAGPGLRRRARTGLTAVGAYVEDLGIDLGPNHGLELAARPGRRRAARGGGADTEQRLHPRLGPHRGGGRHVHLGRVVAQRPHRRLHVARVGVIRTGGDAGDPPRRDLHGPRPGRHRAPRRRAADRRAGRGDRLRADDRRTVGGHLAAERVGGFASIFPCPPTRPR